MGKYSLFKKVPVKFEKSPVLFHDKYPWLSCKPDGINSDSVLKVKYTKYTKLSIGYSDWVYTQILMEITKKPHTIFIIGTEELSISYNIYRDTKWWKQIESKFLKNGTINMNNTRRTRQNTILNPVKKNTNILHSYFEEDLLSYSYFLKGHRNVLNSHQLENIKNSQKEYSLFISKNPSNTVIPIQSEYNQYFEELTIKRLTNDDPIVYNPVVSFGPEYHHQLFALCKDHIVDGNTRLYTVLIIGKTPSKYHYNIVNNIRWWCNKNCIEIADTFYMVSHKGNFPYKCKPGSIISECTFPTKFKLYQDGVVPKQNPRYFSKEHQTIISRDQHISKLTGIGEKSVIELSKQGINTIQQFRDSNTTSKSEHQENILYANEHGVIVHDPVSFIKQSNEVFMDIEFTSNRIVTVVCISINENSRDTKKWKLSSFSDSAERDLLNSLLDYIGTTIVYHWGHADRTVISKAMKRLHITRDLPNTFDIYKDLLHCKLAIPGAWNLKLKSVAKSLYDNNKIESFHPEVFDGQEMKTQFDKWNNHTEFYDSNGDTINRILEYNYYDVQTMYEIICFIRKTNVV